MLFAKNVAGGVGNLVPEETTTAENSQ